MHCSSFHFIVQEERKEKKERETLLLLAENPLEEKKKKKNLHSCSPSSFTLSRKRITLVRAYIPNL
jgi:hypothetical protein